MRLNWKSRPFSKNISSGSKKRIESTTQRRKRNICGWPRLCARIRVGWEMVKEVSAGIGSVIDQRYGVCCFTTKSDSTLMWSHYADHHRGMCVECGADNVVVCAALKVQYCDEYPFLDLADDGALHNLLPLISKSSDWGYEDEYRLVAQERKVALGTGSLMMDDHMLELPARAIKSIIVGCSMPGIRSDVQHLHENRYLEYFDRALRLDIAKKEAIVDHIARTALARVIGAPR